MRHLPEISATALKELCPVFQEKGLGHWFGVALCAVAVLVFGALAVRTVADASSLSWLSIVGAVVVLLGMSIAWLALTLRESKLVVAGDDDGVYFARRSDRGIVFVDWKHCLSIERTRGLDQSGWYMSFKFEDYTGAFWEPVSGASFERGRVMIVHVPAIRGSHPVLEALQRLRECRNES